MRRNEAHAERRGRGNAGEGSRVAALFYDDDDGDEYDCGEGDDGGGSSDAKSVASRFSSASRFSAAPSLHPSLASLAVSEACSTTTIGAGDDTLYWDFAHRTVERCDLGHTCRECKLPFGDLGEGLTERRGARVSMRYHAVCFSGYADPRSQAGSSAHRGRHRGSQFEAAPAAKAGSKMRSERHFEGGGADREIHRRAEGGGGGGGVKLMSVGGSNGFGRRSGRRGGGGEGGAPANSERRQARPGEITEGALEGHLLALPGGESERPSVGEMLRRGQEEAKER